MPQKKLKFQPGEAWIPGLALLFALAYLVQTRSASLEVMRWPYMILAITTIFWLGIVGRYLFSAADGAEKAAFHLRQLFTPALMVGVPVLYLVAMPWLGFALSTFLFLLTLFRILGGGSWKVNLILAFLMTLTLQLALVVLLHMTLPRLVLGSFVL